MNRLCIAHNQIVDARMSKSQNDPSSTFNEIDSGKPPTESIKDSKSMHSNIQNKESNDNENDKMEHEVKVVDRPPIKKKNAFDQNQSDQTSPKSNTQIKTSKITEEQYQEDNSSDDEFELLKNNASKDINTRNNHSEMSHPFEIQ